MLLQAQSNPQMMPLVSQLLQQDPRMMEVFLAMQGISPEEAQTMGQKREPSPPKSKPKEEPKPEPVDERTDQQKEADSWKEKGNAHFKSKEFEQALQNYEKAIAVLPDEMSYYGNKGAVLIEMGRHDECVETCQAALDRRYEMNGNNPGGASYEKVAKLLCRIASSYAKRKDFAKARDFYERSLVEDNNRFTRQAIRDLDRAQDKWEKERMLDPALAEKHKQCGNEFFKKQDYVNAKKEYDEAVKRCPTDPTIYANRAAALTKLLAHPDALRDLDEALRLDPKYVKAYHRKGTCHQFMKEYHKALKAYESGLAIDPNDESCKQGKASVLSTIQAQQSNKEVDEEQVRHAMADPEIQAILKDPQINLVLQQLQENPRSGQEAINKDPKVKEAIEKLMFAGILKVG
jgi:stress-induced-phosphoprotein 1